jgi:hypothetical protein
MGDESEPKTRVWGLNWPFQELGDEIDPRPRVGGRKWLFCPEYSSPKCIGCSAGNELILQFVWYLMMGDIVMYCPSSP